MSIETKHAQLELVQLVQAGSIIKVQPVIEQLRLLFRTIRHLAGGPDEHAIERRLVSHFFINEAFGHLYGPAGLKHIVVEALARMGCSIQDLGRDIDSQLKELGEPEVPPGRTIRPELVGFFSSERGLVRYDARQNGLPASLISLVAKAWPNHRIVCAVTRIAEARDLYRRLARRLPPSRLYCVNHRPGQLHSAQVVIGTYPRLGGFEADLHNTDFWFALRPAEALTQHYGQLCFAHADQARVFAFLPTSQKLPWHQLDRIQACFGPKTLVLNGHEIQRPIQVLLVPFSGGIKVGDHEDNCSLLRCGIWQHEKRNRRVAELAQAIVSGNHPALKRLVRNCRVPDTITRAGSRPRVGVYVANLEQAAALSRFLRGWRLITGLRLHIAGLSAEDEESVRFAVRQPNRRGSGVVITPSGLHRVRHCDILMRADGGSGPLPTQWARSKNTSAGVKNTIAGVCSEGPAIILDFKDRHHPVLRKRSRNRIKGYLEAGWRLSGEYEHELDQYLATRPTLESFL